MNTEKRRTIYSELSKFKPIYETTSNDYIEITEWSNGEGWDIQINQNNRVERFSLHYNELDIINYLIKYLEYNVED